MAICKDLVKCHRSNIIVNRVGLLLMLLYCYRWNATVFAIQVDASLWFMSNLLSSNNILLLNWLWIIVINRQRASVHEISLEFCVLSTKLLDAIYTSDKYFINQISIDFAPIFRRSSSEIYITLLSYLLQINRFGAFYVLCNNIGIKGL